MFSESDWTLRPKWEIIHSRHVTTVKANTSLARMQDSLFSSVNALCFWDGSDVMCAFTGRARAFKRYCATAHGQPDCADRPWRWQVSCLDVSHQNASWVVNVSAFWTQACTFDCQRTRYVTYRAMLVLNQKCFMPIQALGMLQFYCFWCICTNKYINSIRSSSTALGQASVSGSLSQYWDLWPFWGVGLFQTQSHGRDSSSRPITTQTQINMHTPTHIPH